MGGLRKPKPYKGLAMEGMIARWYAKNTGQSIAEFQALAKRIAEELPQGSRVLELAPGPGYLAIELARRGYRVTGVDISRTFVDIAAANAVHAGVLADFRQGDAAALPLPDNTFDFIVCRAAFKNFGDPLGALHEMYRVLRPGGTALIIDMRSDASDHEIAAEVDRMQLGRGTALMTRAILRTLRSRAYSRAAIAEMVSRTAFGTADIADAPIGFDVRSRKT
ncbi:MAG: class I SAM-dependent methyltransferase [Pseudomonadota bacterium]|jgi:ubiquinone/menaquinone biosynthesis C-methylase UbiE